MRQMFDDKQVKALAKDVVKEVIPEAPKEAGIYLLQVVIDSDGKATYSWQKQD
jgi:hypothetical protein